MSENISKAQKQEKIIENYLGSKISLVLAFLFFIALNLIYAQNKSSFLTSDSSTMYPDLSLLFLCIGSLFVLYSAVSFLRVERNKPVSVDEKSRISWSIGRIISDAIFQQPKIFALSTVIYAIFFAFVDGILIYQPSVDFLSAYGFSSPAVVVETCCGPPGSIPVGLVYFPAQHFGVQLIPVSILIMALVSILVGVNVSLIVASVRKTRSMNQNSKAGSFLGGALGAAFGLFAGCPTCAAVFFLSMIAGSGATAFSLTISEYQPEIIALSIPLLFASVVWQAKSIRTIMLGCSL